MEDNLEVKTEILDTQKPKKSGGCLKGCLISLGVFIAGLVATGFFGWKFVEKNFASLLPPEPTTIEIENGIVQKQINTDWQNLANGEELNQGETIKTGVGTEAAINLPTGSQIRLDENTQITLNNLTRENTSIQQTIGRTWSRVENLLGKNSQYEVETPTVVATVRGTAFSATVTDEETSVDTEEDTVEVAAFEKIGTERKIIQKILSDKGNSVRINRKDLDDLKSGKKKLIKEKIKETLRNSEWFNNNRSKDKKLLEKLKNRSTNPLQFIRSLKTLAQVDKSDLNKLRILITKATNGNLVLTETQKKQLANLAVRLEKQDLQNNLTDNAAGILAEGLYIIDANQFSDQNHWQEVLQKVWPLLRNTGVINRIKFD